MRISFLVTALIILFYTSTLYANDTKKDSANLVVYFQNALANTEYRDSFLNLANSIASSNQKNSLIQDTYLYNLSKFYFLTGQVDSSFSIAEQGLKLYDLVPQNKKASKFHNLIGSVYSMKKDYENGIRHFQYAIKILEYSKDYHGVALIQNNIANIFFSLSDYESAFKYSSAAYSTLSIEKDTLYTPLLAGITAMSSIKLGLFEEGKHLTDICIKSAKKYKNTHAEIVGLTCQGELKLEKNEFDSAFFFYHQALTLSEKTNQFHMAILNKINLLTTCVKLKKFNDAIYYGELALIESNKMGNQNTLYSIHKNLAYAYNGLAQYKTAYKHLNKAEELYKESSGIQNKKVINDILIKYDTEKKENEIMLKKLEITKNEIKLSQRNIWIIILIAGIFILIIFYFIYYIFQRQKITRLKDEQVTRSLIASIEGEEKERTRFSAELHDGIASSITSIKIHLENHAKSTNEPELTNIIEQLSCLHEETRRISHNMLPLSLVEISLENAIESFCKENSTTSLKIHFSNQTKVLNSILKSDQLLVYRSIQELVQNVRKHSKSRICHVQISSNDVEYIFSVEDEGCGFDLNQQIKNTGLQSLKNRLESINAVLTIESQTEKGTLACIYLKRTT